jgi:hypothetical protein
MKVTIIPVDKYISVRGETQETWNEKFDEIMKKTQQQQQL